MTTRRTVGRVGALLGAAVVLLIWGAAPAWAAPSVSVDPATDLVDRQVVQVSGAGYSSGTFVGVFMCEPGLVSFSDCDLAPLAAVTTGDRGTFTTAFEVRRFMQTNAGTTDCASAPGACLLFAGTPDLNEVATAPLAFDPDVPGTPPLELTATVDGQATIDRRTGVAFVTITLSCNREALVLVSGSLVQLSSRGVTRGFVFSEDVCDEDPRGLLLTFEPSGGAFSSGDAILRVFAEGSTTDGDSAIDELGVVVHVVRSK